MTEPAPQDTIVDLTTIAPVVAALADLKIREAEIAEQKRALTEVIQNTLGEHGTVGQVDGRTVCTWREHPTSRVDAKALKADFPEIAEKVTKVTTSRRFLLNDSGAGR